MTFYRTNNMAAHVRISPQKEKTVQLGSSVCQIVAQTSGMSCFNHWQSFCNSARVTEKSGFLSLDLKMTPVTMPITKSPAAKSRAHQPQGQCKISVMK